MDPDDALNWMYDKILEVAEECVPLRKAARPKHRIPPERRKLWSRHSKLSKRLRTERSAIKLAEIITERNKIQKELSENSKKSDEREEQDACENIKQNPKYFYSFAKQRPQTRGSVGPFNDPATGLINPDPAHTVLSLIHI